MQGSRIVFLSKLFKEEESAGSSTSSGGKVITPTVATQFKEQLSSLMAKISTTKPHYIRYIIFLILIVILIILSLSLIDV